MIKSIEMTGKTENDAIASALKQLGLDRDSVSVEVIARAKTGFLGIGSQPARIRVSYEVPDAPAPAPVPTPAPVVVEQKPEPQPVVKPEPVVEAAPVVVERPAPVVEEPAPAEEAPAAPKAPRKRPPRKKKKPQTKQQPAPVVEKRPAPVVAEPAPVEAPTEPAEPVEDRTEQVRAFLSGLMEKLDVKAEPVIHIVDGSIYQVELVGKELGALIGRRGETLDAIQQLTNYAVNNGKTQRIRIHIDAENYRAKREESLQRLAHKTAGKALKYRRNMMLEPMNAYERHVIHAALQDYNPSISTYSTGTEPNRRIVVAYSRAGR